MFLIDKSLLPPVSGDRAELYPPLAAIAARRQWMRELADGVADAVIDSAAYMKKLTGGKKLVGAFWGYYSLSQESLLKVYDSGVLDFCSTPPQYWSAREPGHGGCSQNLFLSSCRMHGCVFFEESDFRTYLSEPEHAPKSVTRMRPFGEALGIMRRSIGLRLCGGRENWWFLIGGPNTFNHSEMMETIRRGAEVARETLTTSRWRPAEVAVFTAADEYLTSTLAHNLKIYDTLKMDFIGELMPLCGVPYDSYELGDLENPKLPDYKVYVFPNAFTLSESRRKAMRNLVGRAGRAAIWLGRPGYYRGDKASMENVTSLTNGLAGVVFETEPSVAEMRKALWKSGAHRWLDSQDVMSAGCGFLMVHASSDGVKRIHLPERSWLTEIFGSSVERRGVRDFEETMKRGETRVWKLHL